MRIKKEILLVRTCGTPYRCCWRGRRGEVCGAVSRNLGLVASHIIQIISGISHRRSLNVLASESSAASKVWLHGTPRLSQICFCDKTYEGGFDEQQTHASSTRIGPSGGLSYRLIPPGIELVTTGLSHVRALETSGQR